MKINFRLNWIKSGLAIHRGFKSQNQFQLFNEYLKKIKPLASVETGGIRSKVDQGSNRKEVWFCDRSPKSKLLSSEQVAEHLKVCQDAGYAELHIVIGGADGFSIEDHEKWKPNLLWSFGLLTLPHELASVVAAEQIYRALTILQNHPYHKGH